MDHEGRFAEVAEETARRDTRQLDVDDDNFYMQGTAHEELTRAYYRILDRAFHEDLSHPDDLFELDRELRDPRTELPSCSVFDSRVTRLSAEAQAYAWKTEESTIRAFKNLFRLAD
jgi:hypothetical protein